MRHGAALAWLLITLLGAAGAARAATLVSVGIQDRDYLVVHVLDGEVEHDEGVGENVIRYTPVLATGAAADAANWTVKSTDDATYGTAGLHPQQVHRKTKLSGHAQMEWQSSDFRYEYTYQHWLFLRLPSPLEQGSSYALEIAAATNLDVTSAQVTFDVYASRSAAVHVNLVGYAPDAPHKAADLYQWMGDGGARDYASFVGNTVWLWEVNAGQAYAVGSVSLHRAGAADFFYNNTDLTRSPVWAIDFSGFSTPGTYRLVVEGVGCSEDFVLAADVYREPLRVTLRGFYYMRVGQADTGINPPPRVPLYLPGVSPANTTVYLTTMHPFHAQWGSFTGGDAWDAPNAWAPYVQGGNPTNDDAWGGHADAADWDRHLGHVSIVYDLLLPYILSGGAIDDDGAGIPESGNGIPDLLDTAAFEVDFWLRLRDGAGYAHGLTNPNGSNVLYQAGATAMAAWANAANAAMLADAYRLAGQAALMGTYRDAATAAYTHADGLADPMLDETQDVGYTTVRGRDLKMTAAAYLYNVTGDQSYEAVVSGESVCTSTTAEIANGNRDQTWATAGYLMTPQAVHFPALQANMRASILNEAKELEADLIETRASRRATDDRQAYFRTSQNVQRSLIAHAATTSAADRDLFRKAMALEADWGLGRNPLNMIEMSCAFTALAAKRCVEFMYTSGRDDGVPGIHPGHTPYCNLDDWSPGMVMGTPSRLYENSYPGSFRANWPIGEGWFNSPWVWAHSEFTPQQSMRGKTALYGYLLALAGSAPVPDPTLSVNRAGGGEGTVTSAPAGIDCGATCLASFAPDTAITLTATPAGGSTFGGWSGPCTGTGSCALTLSAATAVTATFDLAGCTADPQCDDDDPCTTDACDLGPHVCTHTPIPGCGADGGPQPGDEPAADGAPASGDPGPGARGRTLVAAGCGCASGGAAQGLAWIGAVLLVYPRRRR